jgi:hypothetical protein
MGWHLIAYRVLSWRQHAVRYISDGEDGTGGCDDHKMERSTMMSVADSALILMQCSMSTTKRFTAHAADWPTLPAKCIGIVGRPRRR